MLVTLTTRHGRKALAGARISSGAITAGDGLEVGVPSIPKTRFRLGVGDLFDHEIFLPSYVRNGRDETELIQPFR